MKQFFVFFFLPLLLLPDLNAQETFKNDQEKFSYALGMIIAQNFRGQKLPELSPDFFGNGFAAATAGKTDKMSVQDANQFANQYMEKFQNAQAAKDAVKFEGNKAVGEEFLAANKAKAGIKTTASGLQYEVLTEGTGASPVATDKVTVHYEGTLITGEVFDSSIKRGKPTSFPLNGVIKGWTEGLQLMKTGGKYRFYIPQELAYGPRATGQLIKPYSTLIFDVELISIEGK